MGELRMPSLGADMDRGTILQWLIAPGDRVQRGDIVAVIDTEKSDIEIEVFESGVVQEILVPVGEEVDVGTPLAVIAEEDAGAQIDAATAPETGAQEPEPAPQPSEPAPRRPEPEPVSAKGPPRVHSPVVRRLAAELGVDLDSLGGTGPGGGVTRADVEEAARSLPRDAGGAGRTPSSPLARRRAAELGADLAAITGTGPGGAVRVSDVEAAAGAAARAEAPAAEHAAPAQQEQQRDRTGATRRATGALMARSKREIPHYYLSTTIDMHPALEWLQDVNQDRPVSERLLPAALLLKATALATRKLPRVNGWWVEDELRLAEAVDLGVGISLRGGGLVAPVIPRADELELEELMSRLRDLVGRARSQSLRAGDMAQPSITVTNLGEQGVESVYGVIAPPQVAVVGFGAVTERPWAVSGMLTVRRLVTATLSADHRATDGHEGARYLSTIDRLLQEPEEL